MGKIQVVVGGQAGSEAKGHCAAQLAKQSDDLLVIRTGGPNAGHTVWSDVGIEYKLRQLPTASISNPDAQCAIAAGAVVDPKVLEDELAQVQPRLPVWIDEQATELTLEHYEAEQGDEHLLNWSTRKGIGAARADRIHRTARTIGQRYEHNQPRGAAVVSDLADLAVRHLAAGGDVLIEAAQGYALGLHTRFYPKTTSADCRAIDALAEVGLSPWLVPSIQIEVWVVVRPYPIRVAGDSGPLEGETSWEELGLPEERTTVTNLVRRVGTWDPELVTEAVRANGGGAPLFPPQVRIAFTMLDQVVPDLAGCQRWADIERNEEARQWIDLVQQCGADVGMVTTSPSTAAFVTRSTDCPPF